MNGRSLSRNEPLLKATLACYIPEVWEDKEPGWAGELRATLHDVSARATGGTCQIWGPDVGKEWLKHALADVEEDHTPVIVVLLPGGRGKMEMGGKCIEQLRRTNLAREARLVAAVGDEYRVNDVLGILDARADGVIPYHRRLDANWVQEQLRYVVRGRPPRENLPFILPWLTTSRENGKICVTGTPIDAEYLCDVTRRVCENRLPKRAGPVQFHSYSCWDELASTAHKLRGEGPVLVHVNTSNVVECPEDAANPNGMTSMDEEVSMGLVAAGFLAGHRIPTICVGRAQKSTPRYWGIRWMQSVWYEYTCEADLTAQLHAWLVGQRNQET